MIHKIIRVGSCPSAVSSVLAWPACPIRSTDDVRFKSDAAPILSFKKGVIAWACTKCGYIEFNLSERDYEKPNVAAPVVAPITRLIALVRQRRRATEQRC